MPDYVRVSTVSIAIGPRQTRSCRRADDAATDVPIADAFPVGSTVARKNRPIGAEKARRSPIERSAMPKVENITLDLEAAPGAKITAMVRGAVRFTAGEVKRKALFRVGISLHGSDEDEAPTPVADPLYVFTWTMLPPMALKLTSIMVPAQTSLWLVKETRTIDGASLDEDQGMSKPSLQYPVPQDLPDEIFARVTVRPVEETASGQSPLESIRALQNSITG